MCPMSIIAGKRPLHILEKHVSIQVKYKDYDDIDQIRRPVLCVFRVVPYVNIINTAVELKLFKVLIHYELYTL